MALSDRRRDHEWPQRIRAGDAAAFSEMFRDCYAALVGFSRGYVLAHDVAEEIVQEVFLRVWAQRQSWHPLHGARSYLFSACRNRALDLLKHERIVARSLDEVAIHAPSPARPDQIAQASELGDALQAEVHGLPGRRRLVFELRWRDGFSHAEIGEALGVSAKCAETQYARAIGRLRERLKRFCEGSV